MSMFSFRRASLIIACLFVTGVGLLTATGTASAAPSPQGAESIILPIGPGSSGGSVSQWQTDLAAWQAFFATCRPSVTVDGQFGPMTTSATECFQRVQGISVDGVVGPQTFASMCFELGNDLRRGDLFNASGCTGVPRG